MVHVNTYNRDCCFVAIHNVMCSLLFAWPIQKQTKTTRKPSSLIRIKQIKSWNSHVEWDCNFHLSFFGSNLLWGIYILKYRYCNAMRTNWSEELGSFFCHLGNYSNPFAFSRDLGACISSILFSRNPILSTNRIICLFSPCLRLKWPKASHHDTNNNNSHSFFFIGNCLIPIIFRTHSLQLMYLCFQVAVNWM